MGRVGRIFHLLHEKQRVGKVIYPKYSKHKVIIEKSRGEGSLMEQDTIENVS